MNIHYWITMAGSGAVLFPLLGAARNLNRLNTMQKRLALLCLVAFMVEALNYSLTYIGIPNLPVINVYVVAEFLLVLAAFEAVLKDFVPRMVFLGLAGAFIAFASYDALWGTPWPGLMTQTMTVSRLLCTLLPILYFFALLKRRGEPMRMERDPGFWFSFAVLAYFAGTIVLIAFRNQLPPDQAERSAFVTMHLHTFLNFLHYILFGIALWTRPKTST